MKRILIVSSLLLSLISTRAADSAHKIKIILIGDSTTQDRTGWGLGFKQFVDTNQAECINLAIGGRSSMSFMKEGRWTNALALKGDYYLIQFGHNNEPGKPGRSTDMPTFVADMTKYVDDALAIGAKPVLVTPLTRRQWDKENPGKIKSSLEPYAEEVRKIAQAKHIPLVELHARSIELCEKLGREKCYEFSPTKIVDGTNTYDGTHLQGIGRVLFAQIVVDELRKGTPELSAVLLAEPRDKNPKLAEDRFDAIVSNDVSANFTNLQAAIDAAPDNGTAPFRISIKPGIYEGQFIIPKEKHNIQFLGEDATNTIITFNWNQNETNGNANPRFRGVGMVVLGDDFRADKITFRNTSGDHGQAIALRIVADRAVLKDCRLLGWQDTLRLNNGRQYFTNCYVEGRVDFIYGSAATVFDRCEIHSKNGGHVTAANTPKDHPFGFVFQNCKLTGDPNPWMGPEGTPAEHQQPADGRPRPSLASLCERHVSEL